MPGAAIECVEMNWANFIGGGFLLGCASLPQPTALSCYQSGASFKDGAKKAPTTLTQITDAFSAVSATYEQRWSTSVV